MESWCALILLIIAAPTQSVARLISRLLDKWAFWQNLPGDVKLLVWSLLSIGLSYGAWRVGLLLSCPDLPDLAAVLYIAANAVWSIWYNKAEHEDRQFEEWLATQDDVPEM